MNRLARAALLLVAFSPAFLCGILVAEHAVEVPIWDDLERATLLQKRAEGTLDWRYVYSPHIEHRMTVPRLITLASAALGDGSLVTEQGLIFGVVLATAILVFGLLRQTFPDRPLRTLGLAFVANVLLFSPLQWETFLFAIQTSFVVPPFGLCLALWALNARTGQIAKFVLCFVAALLASNSFSHGVLLWALVFAAVALQHRFGSGRARAAFLAAWLVATAAVLVPHFTVDGYVNTSEFAYVAQGERAPGLQLATLPDRAPRAANFFGAIIGSPLARTTVLDPRSVAPFAAAFLLGLFAVAAGRALLRWRDPALWDRWLPWLAMGGYAVVASAAPSIGRSALLKWSYGLVPHYLTVTVYLLLAVVVLGILFCEDVHARTRSPRVRALLSRIAVAGLGALLAFQTLQWGIGWLGMREWKSARLQSRTAMILLNHFSPTYVRRVGGDLEESLLLVNRLHDVGYLVPPMLPDLRLCHFGVDPRPLPESEARLRAARLSGDTVVVEGEAWLAEVGRRADGVLFTVVGADPSAARVVVAAAELDGMPYAAISPADHRLDGVRLPGLEEWAGFRKKLPWSAIAAEGPEVRHVQAWAVDSQAMLVRPFAQHLGASLDSGRPRVALRAGPGLPRPETTRGCL